MTEPRADRPQVPGYGVPDTKKGMLAWSWARDRLERAIVYHLATTGSDAAPHLIPIWGAWVNDRWYAEGGPTRWQRNLRENPKLAIHVESGDEVVLVEGTATEIAAPEAGLAAAIVAGYAKYRKAGGYVPEASNWTNGGLWELTPLKAFAWSVFPKDMTRFTF